MYKNPKAKKKKEICAVREPKAGLLVDHRDTSISRYTNRTFLSFNRVSEGPAYEGSVRHDKSGKRGWTAAGKTGQIWYLDVVAAWSGSGVGGVLRLPVAENEGRKKEGRNAGYGP